MSAEVKLLKTLHYKGKPLIIYSRFPKPEDLDLIDTNTRDEQVLARILISILNESASLNEKNRLDTNELGGKVPHPGDYFSNRNVPPTQRIPVDLQRYNFVLDQPSGIIAYDLSKFMADHFALNGKYINAEEKTLNQRTSYLNPKIFKTEYMLEIYAPADWNIPNSLGELKVVNTPQIDFQYVELDKDFIKYLSNRWLAQ